MTNTQEQTSSTEENQDKTQNPWDTVAKDFQNLGQSIADAISNIWHDEDNKSHLNEFRTGLQNMAEQVAGAVDEAVKSPTATEVKTEVKKAVGGVKEMGGKVYTDSKPHVISVLKTLNEGIQNMLERLEKAETEEATSSDSTTEDAK